jgi:hypothetical protein
MYSKLESLRIGPQAIRGADWSRFSYSPELGRQTCASCPSLGCLNQQILIKSVLVSFLLRICSPYTSTFEIDSLLSKIEMLASKGWALGMSHLSSIHSVTPSAISLAFRSPLIQFSLAILLPSLAVMQTSTAKAIRFSLPMKDRTAFRQSSWDNGKDMVFRTRPTSSPAPNHASLYTAVA